MVNKNAPTTKEKIEMFLYCICTGKSKTDAARMLHISMNTINKLLADNPELNRIIKSIHKGETERPFDIGNSLAGFMVFYREDSPKQYQSLQASVVRYKAKVSAGYVRKITKAQIDKVYVKRKKAGLNSGLILKTSVAEITGGRTDNIHAMTYKEGEKLVNQYEVICTIMTKPKAPQKQYTKKKISSILNAI